ncbi:hypothetical protein PRZ48_007459 [Zasmidium cellare]|uniref:Uncharacterized protein n=1 Tax=Zasmidium cellare TaxID=395010 RepID=A0ABR0EJH3_ZASCE|nr:hypothetical protein PRZ48_007459 [Zasmidium cellare]
MGGSAFAQAAAPGQPTLHTPRMTPAEYANLKAIYLFRLQKQFPGKTVSVLIEAPEKTSYGDIDLIVEYDEHVDFIDLAGKLGAAGVICSSSGKHQLCSIAVLKDGARCPNETVVYKNVTSNNAKKAQVASSSTVEEYAQIDIQVIGSEDFKWHSFYCSYGDMGGLLGNITRNLGLTISDKGLVLRLKELDYAKRQKFQQVADRDGMLCLSNDPTQIMFFLGLSPKRYADGFTTVEDFFSWVRECRLIDMEVIKKKRNISRDRQKENKRTLYSTFFEEWLPNSCDMDDEDADRIKGEGEDAVKDEAVKDEVVKDEATKEEVVKDEDTVRREKRDKLCTDAVSYFDKEEEYKTMSETLCRLLCNMWTERLLKPVIADYSGAKDKKLAEIMRAFRRWVCFVDAAVPHITVEPHSDDRSQLFWFLRDCFFLKRLDDTIPVFNKPDKAHAFVCKNWEELKGLERQWGKAARATDSPQAT